jgi:ketosteroid isomerase-like protein
MNPLKTLFCSSLLAVTVVPASAASAPSPESIIKAYFTGWERKDWEAVAGQLAEGFTFTSPAPDDHLPVDKFKAKCWNQTDFIQRFEFPRIAGDGNSAFAIVHVITNDGRVIRNTEYFTFQDGKIKSIEVFFGGNGKGYPSNQ